MSETIKLKTVFGGTVTIDKAKLARALTRNRAFITTTADSLYHMGNLIIPDDLIVLEVNCSACDNWVTLDQDQSKHVAEGYGFDYDDKTDIFKCQECGNKASQKYDLRASD